MKHLNAYSTVCGELPKLCIQDKPLLLVPMNEVIDLKDRLMEIMSDKSHTQYQNECYARFLLRKVGLFKD